MVVLREAVEGEVEVAVEDEEVGHPFQEVEEEAVVVAGEEGGSVGLELGLELMID